MTATVTYLGDLRCSNTHINSNATFNSDAPVDNHGLGASFSPTDTVATSLASCMFTIMGIKSQDLGVDLAGSTAQVTKTMASNPRRISQIDIVFTLKGNTDKRTQLILERVANTCPVAYSLHTDITKNITFNWE